jgi:predicted nucleotidyltransferase component of viral defense system
MESKVDLTRRGAWRALFKAALTLTDHLETVSHQPFWTFGGGTVLMLRLNHRHSRDIDLFVPDPQYLGYLNPRLSDVAESLTDQYVEAATFLKLMMARGEIDVVVGEPLTDDAFEVVHAFGRAVRVETNAEIIAKKMYHRGDQAKARDLFDLCAVAEMDPSSIDKAAPYFARHGRSFLARLEAQSAYAREEFDQIDRIAYKRSFDECIELAGLVIETHLR